MLDASIHFVQFATFITDRLSELLCAPVIVVDGQGAIVTSSESEQIGSAGLQEESFAIVDFLRIPLRHETECGEVIVGKSTSQERISPRLVHALVELVISQSSSQGQSLNQNKLKNQFIADLLHGRTWDEAAILSRAKSLGIDLTPPRAVILIDAGDFISTNPVESTHSIDVEEQRSQFVINSIVSFFHLPNDTICTNLGQGKICVLKASDTKNLDLWVEGNDSVRESNSSWANLTALKRAASALLLRLRNDTSASIDIGIGRYHPGIKGLSQSFEDARAALSLGRWFQSRNQVYCLGELGIAAFVGVADETTKIDLAKYLLSPLDYEPELLTTLNVFFAESCCPSSTAKRLLIHRNTLSYRLDKIASLTGLEPRKFDDAVQMRLSLLLRSLQANQSAQL
jgi:carbohydrate diacid regulator